MKSLFRMSLACSSFYPLILFLDRLFVTEEESPNYKGFMNRWEVKPASKKTRFTASYLCLDLWSKLMLVRLSDALIKVMLEHPMLE